MKHISPPAKETAVFPSYVVNLVQCMLCLCVLSMFLGFRSYWHLYISLSVNILCIIFSTSPYVLFVGIFVGSFSTVQFLIRFNTHRVTTLTVVNRIFLVDPEDHILIKRLFINYTLMSNMIMCSSFSFITVSLLSLRQPRYLRTKGIIPHILIKLQGIGSGTVAYSAAVYVLLYLLYSIFHKLINAVLFFIRVKFHIFSLNAYIMNMVISVGVLMLYQTFYTLISAIVEYNDIIFLSSRQIKTFYILMKYNSSKLENLIKKMNKEKIKYNNRFSITVPSASSGTKLSSFKDSDINPTSKNVTVLSFGLFFHIVSYHIRMRIFRVRYRHLFALSSDNSLILEDKTYRYEYTYKQRLNRLIEELNDDLGIDGIKQYE